MTFGLALAMYFFAILLLALATRYALTERPSARDITFVAIGWLLASAMLFAMVGADRMVGG